MNTINSNAKMALVLIACSVKGWGHNISEFIPTHGELLFLNHIFSDCGERWAKEHKRYLDFWYKRNKCYKGVKKSRWEKMEVYDGNLNPEV